MIDQTASDIALQSHTATRANVTLTAEPFGPVPAAPALAWSLHQFNPGNDAFVIEPVSAAVGLADGSLLRFRWVSGASLDVAVMATPESAASWRAVSWSAGPAVSGTVVRIAAARDGDEVRCAWVAGGNLHVSISTDGGASWGAASAVYSGGDADDYHIGVYHTGGVWVVGWSTTEPRAYVAWDDAGWQTFSYFKNHRFAGALVGDDSVGYAWLTMLTFVDNSLSNVATSLVRRVHVRMDNLYDTYLDCEIMMAGDAATNFYNLFYRKLFDGDAGLLGEATEGGTGGGFLHALSSAYNGALADDSPDRLLDVRIDEPVQAHWQYKGSLYDAAPSRNHELAAAGDHIYALLPNGDSSEVWIGAPVTVQADGYELISYKYDWRLGRATLELAPCASRPVAGSLLVVAREIERGGESHSQTLKLLALRVERHADKITVLAVDSLGWLSSYRARRTVRISDGQVDQWISIPRLLARCGLLIQQTDSVGDKVSFAVTHKSGEAGVGALYRLLATGSALLAVIPGEFGVRFSDIGDNCGDHDYGGSGVPVFNVTAISDARRFSSSYILGQRSTDPADGSYLGGFAGPVLPGVRPLPVSYTNTRYNSPLLVNAAAQAEAYRQLSLHVDAVVVASPNFGLELYDRVQVTWPNYGLTAQEFRLHRVIERYDRHGLRQELHLGDVSGMYDIWDEDDCNYAFD